WTKSYALRITHCLAITPLHTNHFTVPPTPSTAPRPCPVEKKFQIKLTL
ncbi:unnamed protein product, partial [Rotaria magnacalcarata]